MANTETTPLTMKSCVQLPPSADNVILPAFALAQLLQIAAVQPSIDISLLAAGPTAPNPQQWGAAAWWTDAWTDARQLHRPCSV